MARWDVVLLSEDRTVKGEFSPEPSKVAKSSRHHYLTSLDSERRYFCCWKSAPEIKAALHN